MTDPTHKAMHQLQIRDFTVALILDGRPRGCSRPQGGETEVEPPGRSSPLSYLRAQGPGY